jgi:hypothetical protein
MGGKRVGRIERPSPSKLVVGALGDELGEKAAVADAAVVAGAQERERDPEIAFQRRELFV